MLAGSKADGKDKDDGGGARDSGAHAADPSKDDGYEPPVSAPPGPDGSAIPAPDGASPAGTAPGGAGGDGGRGVAGLDGSDGSDGIGGEGGLGCVCSIESGPCERVDVFHVSGRFWSTSACGEKRTPARPAWTSFPS